MGTDFQCRKCGECCRSRFHTESGAAGLHVYVAFRQVDKEKISKHLKITIDQLEEKYGIIGGCLPITGRQCPFLNSENQCFINEVKPQVCASLNPCEK